MERSSCSNLKSDIQYSEQFTIHIYTGRHTPFDERDLGLLIADSLRPGPDEIDDEDFRALIYELETFMPKLLCNSVSSNYILITEVFDRCAK